ncbi:MAG: two-component system, OmpR family, sensor kinase [Frankiaceae bacterium]|nr:two-component system, OmpR family, sensor kinase [Frankiaceae bacterium]
MSGSASRSFGDEILVRRAGRRVAVFTAGLVMLALLALIALVSALVVHGQSAANDNLLRTTVANADDVGDPPPGTWLIVVHDGQLAQSSGLPPELSPRLAELRAAAEPATVLAAASGSVTQYRVATRERAGDTVQAVLDLAPQHELRTRLLQAMALAGVCGLAFSAILGALIGRRAVRPMAEALALQRMFIADASHELRTPLTLLSTRAQLLDRAIAESGATPDIVSDSRGIVHDVQRLDEIVDDLLAAADPRRQVDDVAVDVVALVFAAVESAGAHANARNVVLRSENQTPALSQLVVGSATALRRAVLALVDNAIDHTPPGGTVMVATRVDERRIAVTVSDTGPGVRAGEAADLFHRFHSGGQRTGRSHYGLGLALSHDIANRHGGHLRLVPTDRGARFELMLPRDVSAG